MSDSKTYKFTHNGKTYSIPAFNSLPTGVIRKSRKGEDDTDRTFLILEAVMPEGSPELAALDAMSTEDFIEFLKGWTQGSSVGESSDS